MSDLTTATTLVALHGFTGSAASFSRLHLPELWAPSLGGHGPDPDLSAPSFNAEVERLTLALRKRLTAPVHLLGYSMGARVALGLALAHPELIARLTLVGVNPGLRSSTEREARLDWESRWIRMLELDGLTIFERQWRALPLFDSQGTLPRTTREQQTQERLSHTASGLAHALRSLGQGVMPNLWGELSRLEPPCDLVVGASDEKFTLIAEEMNAQLRNARIIRIAACGHNPLLENPERLRSLLLNHD